MRKRIVRSHAPLALAGAALLAAACAPAQSAPVDGPSLPRETPGHVEPRRYGTEIVTLTQVSREALGGRGYPALGLSGANKPQGPGMRLREGVDPGTPASVPRTADGLPLFLTDRTADGWLALYRTPMGEWTGSKDANARYHAALYGFDGRRRWGGSLNGFLSGTEHLEVQDVRYEGGKLYFNEACQSYSAEAGGRCSSLVRVDAASWRVDWRSVPLTSNNVFVLHGPYVIAGYGFTREPDRLFVLDRETGRPVASAPLQSAPSYIEVKGGDVYVITYNSFERFRLSIP